ncbi:peptide chain release factor N(5)-glutamine methyltransferase [Candidatus Comchoanobacter bicostacola]|uniref:Peptide chain release factor N(5)-glutamine methyltransferase n=1 Tax=Candidatus Comchoanobacter bicostacola TaxID=2919598 RepID=A0ABY5DIN8_9GAMM|nr:peptide chain release factor N(5)-glutamine methyltransferase [Candidatus Comchoanobacter bicostacola]UTC24465.1 peptide chain release factor N(5)-glutamine methyltransferase [Candidatus Comchoanobacter bicostacola]
MGIDLAQLHREWVEKTGGSEQSYREVFWIIAHCLSVSWSDLHKGQVITSTDDQEQRVRKYLAQYEQGMPLAYILQYINFMGLDYEIVPGVLIPRQATESIVHAALAVLKPGDRVLECGVGSGIIACSLAKHRQVDVLGIDCSTQAITLAHKNILRHQCEARVTLKCCSWYDALPQGFDLLIANPPYIEKGDPDLSTQVAEYEPETALISGDKGLADIKQIIKQANSVLNQAGWLIIEHGYKQQDAVIMLGESAGFVLEKKIIDPEGLARGVVLKKID